MGDKNSHSLKITVAVLAAAMIFASLAGCIGAKDEIIDEEPAFSEGNVELKSPCMLFVPEPQSEKDMLYIALVSQLTCRNGTYNPLFIVAESGLDGRAQFTINSMSIKDCPKYGFGVESVAGVTFEQTFAKDLGIFGDFKGFDDEITVASYDEALWLAGLAAAKNLRMVYGNATAATMSDAWKLCAENGMNASYVIVTNEDDYREDCVNDMVGKWHVPSLSAVAAELAYYHKAMVLTTGDLKSVENSDWPIEYEEDENNGRAAGVLTALRSYAQKYGPVDYVCIVGSGAAVPQFRVSQSGDEDRGHVAGDVFYGFTVDDEEITSAISRIINLNVASVSNTVARTLGYGYLVEANANNWLENTVAENGYEVSDARAQNTPGLFFKLESDDEGYNGLYTSSAEAGTTVDLTNQEPAVYDLKALLEKCNLIAYRGHGSSTGTFYSWSHFLDDGTEGIEDWDLAPSTVLIAACLTGKIYGYDSDGTSLKLSDMICMNFLHGGIVSYVSPTEISYSEIGQDAVYYVNGEWGKNNYIYCHYWNNILNYDMNTGMAFKETIKGYMEAWDVNPFYSSPGSADGKTVIMYCQYGDPMFTPWQNPANAGPGSYNYFENGITG